MYIVFYCDKIKDIYFESCCSFEKGGQLLFWFEYRKNVLQFVEFIEMLFGFDFGKGVKSLVEFFDEFECILDEEIFIL